MTVRSAYLFLVRAAAGSALVLLAGAGAEACPNCGVDAMKRQQGGQEIAAGYVAGFVGLGSAPLLVGGAIAIVIRRMRRYDGSTGHDDEGACADE